MAAYLGQLGGLQATALPEGGMNTLGQALTEYTVILMFTVGIGVGAVSIFAGFDALHDIFRLFYASLANFINLPFF